MAISKKPTAAKKKSAPSANVFDISKPGKSGVAASATSRPIIIKHQVTNDPMVNEAQAEDRQTAPTLTPAAKKIVIQPLSETVETDVEVQIEAVEEEVATPAAIPESAKSQLVNSQPTVIKVKPPTVEPEPQPVAPPVKEPEPITTIPDEAFDDAPGVPAEPEARDADIQRAREKAARLEKMIEDEEYFLPIETIEERRNRKVAILGLLLIIVLAAAWYNVALDAGLLTNTYNLPHTSFFSVKP